MKRNKTLFGAVCLAFCAGLMSCGSDSPPSVSKDDAKVAFSNVNQNLVQDIGLMTEAPGYTALTSLTTLTDASDPFGAGRIASYKRNEVRSQIKSSFYAFRSILLGAAANGRVNGSQPFDFNGKKGVYTYNTDHFDVALGGDIIKILFPTEGSLTNNAEFQLTGYTEQETPNGDDLYSPTFVRASILIDGVMEAKLELDADYGTDDEPVLVDLYFYVKPYAIDVNFNDTGATATSFSETLSKSGATLIGASLKVTFETAEKNEEEIKAISGHLQLMNIRFNFNLTAQGVANGQTDITVKIDGGDAGDVIIEEDAITGEPVPYIKYHDGTSEKLGDLFEDLVVQLQGI